MAGARLIDGGRPVRHRHSARRRRTVVALCAVGAVVAALVAVIVVVVDLLVPPSGGAALAAERIDPAAGAPVTIQIVDGVRTPDDQAVAAVFGDLQTFWDQELPRLGVVRFQALRGGYASVDGAGPGSGALCAATAASVLGNAYYCPSDDGIVYDSAALVPVLLDRYGSAGLTASLAHEFGHAIQAQLGGRSDQVTRRPAILQEAMADCDAGAFLAWLSAGAPPTLGTGTGTGTGAGTGTAPATGSPPGPAEGTGSTTTPPTQSATPPTQSATPPTQSATPPTQSATPPTTPPTQSATPPMSSPSGTGTTDGKMPGTIPAVAGAAPGAHVAVRLPPSSLLRAVTPLVEFRDQVDADPTGAQSHGLGLDRLRAVLAGVRGGATACPALTVEGLRLTEGRIRGADTSRPRFTDDAAVDLAATDSVRAFDPTALPAGGSTAADPANLLAAAPFGQFARAAATALAAGHTRFGADRPAAAACYLGAWTGFVYGRADAGQLGSWPGDADEAMDMLRTRPGATFDEVAGFATGFDGGLPSCTG